MLLVVFSGTSRWLLIVIVNQTDIEVNPMIIAVAGPYSHPDPDQRQRNLDRMNDAAREVLHRGHTPLIGVNAALPIARELPVEQQYDAIMKISLAVVSMCDALLLLEASPGATRERDAVAARGGVIYTRIEDVPHVS